MIGVDVDTSAADQLLGRAQQVLEDDRTLLTLGAQLLADHEAVVFATGDRGRWAPLDPATVRAKGSGRVLVDTGGLLADLTDPDRASLDGDTVTLGLRGKHGEVAGYLKRGARGMPRRDPAPAPDEATVRDWAREVVDLVLGETRR